MGSEVRSFPKHLHWSRRTPATAIQPWERKRMKRACVSFSSHGLCSLKHPACIQPGTRIVAEGHTPRIIGRQGWHQVWVTHHPQRSRNTMWVQLWSLNLEETWAGGWAPPFRDSEQPASPSPSLQSPLYHACGFCAAAPTPAPKLLVMPFCPGDAESMHPKSCLFTLEPSMDDDVACDGRP